MTGRITDKWATVVQATGAEVTITLLVQGAMVSGYLTAPSRYHDWEARSYAICMEMGNGGQENSAEPPTDAERALIQENWKADHGDEAVGAYSPPVLCLRNGTVMNDAGIFTFAFLLVDADSVDAITMGAAQP